MVLPHIVEGLQQLAGHLADIGGHQIQGNFAAVIVIADIVFQIGQGVEGGVQGGDVFLHILAEGLDFLWGVVPAVQHAVSVIPIGFAAIQRGDIPAQLHHAEIQAAQPVVHLLGQHFINLSIGGGVNGLLLMEGLVQRLHIPIPPEVLHRAGLSGDPPVFADESSLLLAETLLLGGQRRIDSVVGGSGRPQAVLQEISAGGAQDIPHELEQGVGNGGAGGAGELQLLCRLWVGGIPAGLQLRQNAHGLGLLVARGQHVKALLGGSGVFAVIQQSAQLFHLRQYRLCVYAGIGHLAVVQLSVGLAGKKGCLAGAVIGQSRWA